MRIIYLVSKKSVLQASQLTLKFILITLLVMIAEHLVSNVKVKYTRQNNMEEFTTTVSTASTAATKPTSIPEALQFEVIIEGIQKEVESRSYENLSYTLSKRYNTDVDVRPRIIFRPNDEYHDLKEFDALTEIPLIIHQTNKNHTVSVVFQKWMQSWLKFHPNWQYWFWTDEDIKKFITTRYPEFKKPFFAYDHNIKRSDVFRYFLLHEFGGVYADCDMECLKPLDDLIQEHDCILGEEPYVHLLILESHYHHPHLISNAFMASRPRHPYFKFAIELLLQDGRPFMKNAVHSTGPIALTEAYTAFTKIKPDEDVPFVPDEELLLPMFDPRRVRIFKKTCWNFIRTSFSQLKYRLKARKSCRPFLKRQGHNVFNGPTENSYAVHRWTNTWAEKWQANYYFKGLGNKTASFNVKDLKPK